MIKWITVMLIIIMIIIGESFQFHRTKRDSITNVSVINVLVCFLINKNLGLMP